MAATNQNPPLPKEEFDMVLRAVCQRLEDLTASKGREYAKGEDNQLANFDDVAEELGTVPELVHGVFLSKHMRSIAGYVQRVVRYDDLRMAQTVLSEPIEGRIDDAILYLVLLRAMVYRRRKAIDALAAGSTAPT
jgi:hypothetical protein